MFARFLMRLQENKFYVLIGVLLGLALIAVMFLVVRMGINKVEYVEEYVATNCSVEQPGFGFFKASFLAWLKPILMLASTVLLAVTVWRKDDNLEFYFVLSLFLIVLYTLLVSLYYNRMFLSDWISGICPSGNGVYYMRAWVQDTDLYVRFHNTILDGKLIRLLQIDVGTIIAYVVGLKLAKMNRVWYFVSIGLITIVNLYVLIQFSNSELIVFHFNFGDYVSMMWLEIMLIAHGVYYLIVKRSELFKYQKINKTA